MFGRKRKRIEALENELEATRQAAHGLMLATLTKLEKFDPETYHVGLGVLLAQRVNEDAAKQYQRMLALHEKQTGRANGDR